MKTPTTDFVTILGDTALRATILLTATALLALLARRASAAHRHLLWALGLADALCLAPLSLALPRLPTLPLPAVIRAGVRPQPSPSATMASDAAARSPVTVAGETAAPPLPNAVTAPPRRAWPLCLTVAWLAGCLLVLGRLAGGALAVRGLARASRSITGGPLAEAVRGACQALPVNGITDFRQATASEGGAQVPMSWGLRRPVAVLPAGAECWPPARVHAALLHEMAHVVRKDWPVQIVAELACALYWFHPLVWLAARRVRAEAEHACDDRVLAAGVGPADYAGHLVAVARAARALRATPVAAVGMVRPSALGRRLDAVLAPDARRDGRTFRTAAAALALTAACVCLLAALGPATANDTGAEDAVGALRGVVVVIDPGHGGQDTGAVSAGGVTEKSLNFDIAQRVRAALEGRGATVFLTRDGDTFPALPARPHSAALHHADYFVSLHCDDVPAQVYGGPGTVVYFHDHAPVGRRLAGSVGAGLGQATGEPNRLASDLTRFSPGGFGVLRGASMPAVLVECGDMALPADLARLRDPQGQQRIAAGIAAGLSAYQGQMKQVKAVAGGAPGEGAWAWVVPPTAATDTGHTLLTVLSFPKGDATADFTAAKRH